MLTGTVTRVSQWPTSVWEDMFEKCFVHHRKSSSQWGPIQYECWSIYRRIAHAHVMDCPQNMVRSLQWNRCNPFGQSCIGLSNDLQMQWYTSHRSNGCDCIDQSSTA